MSGNRHQWVTFNDLPDYDITIAEVMDIAVASAYQRQSIGLKMMRHIEDIACKRGATFPAPYHGPRFCRTA